MSWKTLGPRAAILGTEQNVSKDSSAGEWICIISISSYPYLCHFIVFFSGLFENLYCLGEEL